MQAWSSKSSTTFLSASLTSENDVQDLVTHTHLAVGWGAVFPAEVSDSRGEHLLLDPIPLVLPKVSLPSNEPRAGKCTRQLF